MKKVSNNIYTSIVERIKALDNAVHEYNQFIADLNEKLSELLDEQISKAEVISGLIEDLRDSAGAITDAQEGYYEERSDAWKESDSGDNYTEWMESWTALVSDLPDAPDSEYHELDQMEEVDLAVLENLTQEP